jgi:hypothetical protein
MYADLHTVSDVRLYVLGFTADSALNALASARCQIWPIWLRPSLRCAAKGRGGGATKSAAAKKAAETRKRNAETKTGGKAKSARYK